MTNLVSAPNFVKPYFIEALGTEGLTAHDVARGLTVDAKHVLEKLRREKWTKRPEWLGVVYTTTNESNGLCFQTRALTTEGAKAFVSRYVNSLGDDYLKFLFQCERAVVAMASEIERLRGEIAALKAPKVKQLKRGAQLVEVVTREAFECDIFGNVERVTKTETQDLTRLHPRQRKAWQLLHAHKVQAGLSRRIQEMGEDLMLEDGAIRLLPDDEIH